jgi:GNAT superfamily N-acetyltransferase
MIRPLTEEHIDQIEAICYPYYYPKYWDDDLHKRVSCHPEGNIVCVIDKKVVGYLFSQPFIFGESIKLSDDPSVPPNPDCYYIHDVAVAKEWKRKSVGTLLVNMMICRAKERGWKRFALTALPKSTKFHESNGFKITKEVIYNNFPAFYMVQDFQ